MVGGVVIETRTINSSKVWVNVEERPVNGSHKPSTCAIYVNPVCVDRFCRASISRGDAIWWQGEYAMWTPADAEARAAGWVDVRMKRIGFSGVSTPEHCA